MLLHRCYCVVSHRTRTRHGPHSSVPGVPWCTLQNSNRYAHVSCSSTNRVYTCRVNHGKVVYTYSRVHLYVLEYTVYTTRVLNSMLACYRYMCTQYCSNASTATAVPVLEYRNLAEYRYRYCNRYGNTGSEGYSIQSHSRIDGQQSSFAIIQYIIIACYRYCNNH